MAPSARLAALLDSALKLDDGDDVYKPKNELKEAVALLRTALAKDGAISELIDALLCISSAIEQLESEARLSKQEVQLAKQQQVMASFLARGPPQKKQRQGAEEGAGSPGSAAQATAARRRLANNLAALAEAEAGEFLAGGLRGCQADPDLFWDLLDLLPDSSCPGCFVPVELHVMRGARATWAAWKASSALPAPGISGRSVLRALQSRVARWVREPCRHQLAAEAVLWAFGTGLVKSAALSELSGAGDTFQRCFMRAAARLLASPQLAQAQRQQLLDAVDSEVAELWGQFSWFGQYTVERWARPGGAALQRCSAAAPAQRCVTCCTGEAASTGVPPLITLLPPTPARLQ
jgi:hypothetical protein